jgi:hypothetical protein
MNTLTLDEAAGFLKMHPEEVRRRAKRGLIPACKPCRRWVFIGGDLAAFRGDCPQERQALRVTFEEGSAPRYPQTRLSLVGLLHNANRRASTTIC